MKVRRIVFVQKFLFCLCIAVFPAQAEDFTRLGGDLTTRLPAPAALQVPAPNIAPGKVRDDQVAGFAPFHRRFGIEQGLGPRFNNDSCGACHIQNGKGVARIPKGLTRAHGMIIKVGLRSNTDTSIKGDVPGVGEQLQEKDIRKRKRQFRVRLRWRLLKRKYPDGQTFTLRKPILRFRIKGIKRVRVGSSLRMTPALVGMGLLEAIPESYILSLSDPEDSDGDGISGRPRYVLDREDGMMALGRFGFKANHPSVKQQSAAAAFFDMGLSNEVFNTDSSSLELDAETLAQLTRYQQLAGVPAARDQEDPQVLQGQDIFFSIGCESCHRQNILSEHDELNELDGQLIHPFTDLLLHDMGQALADSRPEDGISTREWRTTPLWGLGHLKTVASHRLSFLHDGRARSLEEAILWHGGEAEQSKQAFMHISRQERHALISFLNSL